MGDVGKEVWTLDWRKIAMHSKGCYACALLIKTFVLARTEYMRLVDCSLDSPLEDL